MAPLASVRSSLLSHLLILTCSVLKANNLQGDVPNQISWLPISILDLSVNNINSFYVTSTLPNITSLNLGLNNITQFHAPPMPNLQILDVSQNNMDAISGLSLLPSLTSLYLHINPLGPTLTTEICSVSNTVITLLLIECGLTALPPCMENLDNVTWIDLSSNLFTEEPSVLGSMSALESIDLSKNSLMRFPSFVLDLPNINRLILSNNQMSGTVPYQLNEKNLSQLGNYSIYYTLQLIMTDISSNSLTGCAPDPTMMNLNLYNIYGNPFAGVPVFSTFQSGKTITYSDNLGIPYPLPKPNNLANTANPCVPTVYSVAGAAPTSWGER